MSTDGSSGESVGRSRAAIIGGDADTTDVAVVALMRTSTGALCSGAIVAPTVVLTAAHCVFGVAASDLQVLVGASTTAPDRTLAVASVVAYPTYTGESDGLPGGVDLGVVILAAPVTLTPLAVDTVATTFTPGTTTATVVGYGVADSADITTAGTRREVSLTIDSACTRLISAGESGSNACVGDSGGPVMIGGAIVAVVSGGAADCNGPTKFTRIDAHANWIAAALAGNAAAACPSCVAPDPSCGAATETAPAQTADAGVDAPADGSGAPGAPSSSGCRVRRAPTKGSAGPTLAALVALGLLRHARRRAVA